MRAFSDADFLTRGMVFSIMVENWRDQPRTPKYGLLLLLDGWNARFPNGIDSKGQSPREATILTLMGLWASLHYDDFTPETCGRLLAQSDKWVFEKRDEKWRVAP